MRTDLLFYSLLQIHTSYENSSGIKLPVVVAESNRITPCETVSFAEPPPSFSLPLQLFMKSGFVNIFGRPNAGKSTLLNALMGEKLAIVSPKVQTTRHRIKGIITEKDYQVAGRHQRELGRM